MRLWEGIPRDSCHQRGKPYIFLLPRFCMKSKCNMYIHIPSSPSPHFSLQAPEAPPKWRRLSWDTSSPPHAEAPCGSHSCPLTGWVPRSGAEGRSGQGWMYVCERSRAPLASGVAGTRGIRSTLSRVGKFDNLGEVPAAVGMVCLWPEKAFLAACGRRDPWLLRNDEGAPHPTEPQTPRRPADSETRRFSVFTYAV